MDILFTHFDKQISSDVFEKYQAILPLEIQKRLNRFKRWQDSQASLVGKILLFKALGKIGYGHDCLRRMNYSPHGRPFIDDKIDFNISHSENCVVCSISKEGRVGIDIERVKEINIEDFKNYLTPQELKHVYSSNNIYEVFYRYWTMYESILKADGRGLSSAFSNVNINKGNAELDGKSWFVETLNPHPEYICSIAADKENQHFDFLEIKFEDFN